MNSISRERGHVVVGLVFGLTLVSPSTALADTERTEGSLAVKVDVADRNVRFATCAAAPCATNAASPKVAIDLAPGEIPDPKEISVRSIAIGEGKRVVHVRVPAKGRKVAWEAIFAAGSRAPIFAGLTGLYRGEDGERTGTVIEVYPRDDSSSFVVLGDAQEDLRICGQAMTPLAPRVLETKTMTFRGATMQRLPYEQRTAARQVTAVARSGPSDPPQAALLVANGSSVPSASAGLITDADTKTSWMEERPGDGRGEFVVMQAPAEVPIAKLVLTVRGAGEAQKTGAAPKTFFLVTGSETIAVTMPDDAWAKVGATYEIPLAPPIKTSCLTLVLDQAWAPEGSKPDVSIAELTALSEFDGPGATLEKTAEALTGGGARGEAAAAVLKRAGPGAIPAVSSAFEKLDPRGRALAMDVAASAPSCDASGQLLARGMVDADREVARKGRSKLERCGKSAIDSLIGLLKRDPNSRARVAPFLATMAPAAALAPIAAVTGEGSAETRGALRNALSIAARAAEKEKIAAIVSDASRAPAARLDLLRALGARLAEVPDASHAAFDALSSSAPPLATRYLLLVPVAEVARAGDARAGARLSQAITSDPEWAVRAKAAELAAGIESTRAALLMAARDREPRVRDAALRALATFRGAEVVPTAANLLAKDRWTFVRVSAITALAAAPSSVQTDDAVGRGLRDPSSRVRGAAAEALGTRRASSWAKALRVRLDDKDEEPQVRAAAARALGATCERSATDRLTALAKSAASPVASEELAEIGAAAIVALGLLHPADLAKRLAPLLEKGAPPGARAAATRAIASEGACR